MSKNKKIISKPSKKLRRLANKEITKQAVVVKELPSVIVITKKAFLVLWNNKKFWLILLFWYLFFNLLFVKGFSSNLSVSNLKSQFEHLFSGTYSRFNSSLTVLLLLVSSTTSNNVNQSTGAFNFFLLIFISLIMIWSLIQINQDKIPKVKDAIYRGIYPIVPFVLILFILALELLPATIGASVYNIVKINGIAAHAFEQVGWFIFFIGLLFWSLYMISSSIFALYIVVEQNINPIAALKQAKRLVSKRRLLVLRKILFLPLLIVVFLVIIMIPSILLFSNFASWIFYLLTIIIIPIIHSYLYNLYQDLKQ